MVMKTKIYKFEDSQKAFTDPDLVLDTMSQMREIGEMLSNGELVAFPTETVYGLGANAYMASAVNKIFEAKGRPSDNPLIVHIADFSELDEVASEVTDVARRLTDEFWPGPLTVVLKKSSAIPDEVTCGLDTVAIRMPAHPIAKSVIRFSGVPIAAPSANISGRPSPTTCAHVIDDLDGKISAIVCGDISDIGIESTVVDCTGAIPVILRPGSVTADMIREVVGEVVESDLSSGGTPEGDIPSSPGMKYTHYAPKARLVLYTGSETGVSKRVMDDAADLRNSGEKVGILTFDEHVGMFAADSLMSMGSKDDPDAVAMNLYKMLREFDKTDVTVILAEQLPKRKDIGIGAALMNRMAKAASEVIEI
jgi:L-threonylcarbamoyladenylate synthase